MCYVILKQTISECWHFSSKKRAWCRRSRLRFFVFSKHQTKSHIKMHQLPQHSDSLSSIFACNTTWVYPKRTQRRYGSQHWWFWRCLSPFFKNNVSVTASLPGRLPLQLCLEICVITRIYISFDPWPILPISCLISLATNVCVWSIHGVSIDVFMHLKHITQSVCSQSMVSYCQFSSCLAIVVQSE